MRIEYPGHSYYLHTLDSITRELGGRYEQILVFVMRTGPKYPGNPCHFAGTNLQEVFRACLDRVWYLDKQQPCWQNKPIKWGLSLFIWLLEWRAARKHKRAIPGIHNSIFGKFCLECGHVGCKGECHA
jgi:hypothetical protein